MPTSCYQAALERLEGRGGETWRGCLQRMVMDQGRGRWLCHDMQLEIVS